MWKTTDNGTTWSTNTDNLPVLGVSDIAINPTNPDIMYIATGDGDLGSLYGNGDTKSIGVLKSTDGGNTWNTTGMNWDVTASKLISKLAMNPSFPQELTAATSDGLWRTLNSGTTWTQVKTGYFMDVEFKPNNADTLYASTYDNNNNGYSQIFRSTDYGTTWSVVASLSGVIRINLAVSPNWPSLVDALCASTTNGLAGLWFSLDNGASFSQYYDTISNPNLLHSSYNGSGTGGQGSYDLAYAINPTNASDYWLGGVNTWHSSDGGFNWNLNNFCFSNTMVPGSNPNNAPVVHADKHQIAFHPLNSNYVFECNDGGVFETNNNGASWNNITNGMGISQIYRIGTSATVANNVICGLQDNSTKAFSNNTWSENITGGDGMECIIDYSNASIKFATAPFGAISKTIDGGSNWNSIVSNNGYGVNEKGAWVTPFIMHPSNHYVLLVGKSQVYQTADGGNTWTQLGAISGMSGKIISMAYAPSNPQIIYVASFHEIFKTTDGGFTWNNIGTNTNNITYMAVDPTNPNKLFITFSGYTPGTKVEMTPDGTTWYNYSGSLPNVPVNCIVYQAGSNEGLYIGTDLGVFYTDASLSDWIPFNNNLPNVVVTELEISVANNKLWAATFGRGLWSSDLYSVLAVSTTASPNMICKNVTTQLNANATGGTSYSYSWSSNPAGFTSTLQSPTVSPTTTTTYTITVTSNSNTATSSVVVSVNPLPAANAGSDTQICYGASTQLSAAGGSSYSWSPTTGLNASTIANPIASPVSSITYTVVVTNANGCTASDNVIVTVNPLPTANAGADVTINSGQSTTLTATGGSNYAWSNGQNTTSITVSPTTTTTYSVTVANNGCSASDAVVITVVGGVLSVSAAANPANLCMGSSSQLTASPSGGSGSYSYAWSSTPVGYTSTLQTASVSPTVSTTYTVTVTSNSSTATSSVIVIVNTIPATPTIVQNGAVLTSSATTGNQWYFNGVLIGGATNQTYTATQNGNYTVAVTNNGCSSNVSSPAMVAIIASTDVCFNTATDFAAGTTPYSICAADFNGDGFTDIAVANSGSGNISVLLGNSAGNLSSATNYVAGTSPWSIISKDVNADSFADLVVANSASNNVSILLGNGSGSFGAATNFAVGTNPTSVISADFNGDSKSDIAVVNAGYNNVSILLGNGAGSFGAASNFSTGGSSPRSIINADFNGDGFLDLAIANFASNNVSILIGTGTGSFGTASNYSVGTNPTYVISSDFNGDGFKDLATANYSSNNVSVLLGTGTGSFASAINYTAGTGSTTVVSTDFNSDGFKDLATANYGSNNVSVLPGTGSGTFGAATNYTAGSGTTAIISADFNGDGRADLATANQSGTASVLLNCKQVGVSIAITAGSNQLCAGTSVTFTATPINGGVSPTYQWKVNGVTTGANSATFTTSSLANGETVTCQMTSNLSGVTGNPAISNGIVMTVNILPTANAGSDVQICNGNPTQLNATGGSSYNWSPTTGLNASIISNPLASPVESTTYTVVVTNANGCSASDNVAVTVNSIPLANTGSSQSVCSGNQITLGAGAIAGNTYSWSSNPAGFTSSQSNPTVTPTITITYTLVEIISATGCSKMNTVIISANPLPVTPTIAQSGNQIYSSSSTGNQWYLGGNIISGATSTFYTPTQNGNYQVQVTDAQGCVSAMSIPLYVSFVGILELSAGGTFQIFPNPTNGIINIAIPEKSINTTISVSNIIGEEIKKTIITNNAAHTITLDLSGNAEGNYNITIKTEKSNYVQKISILNK